MKVFESPAASMASSNLETQLASVAASLPGVICSYRQTADGKRSFPFASENCFKIYGILPEELRASADVVFERIHPDDLRHVGETIEASATSGRVWRDEFRYDHPTRGLIWLEGQSSPVREPNGDIIWHGYVQDISDRKRAEKQLRISEARYRAFFDSGLIGVISWNIDGAITDANNTFLEMLGYSREDLEAGRINRRQITPPESLEAHRKAIENIRTRGSTPPYEKEYFRKDGARVPVLIASATLDVSHQEGVSLVLDLTERKKDEARLQQLHVERLNCCKSLAAGLAHEINQPLSAAVTYLRAIKRLLGMEPDQRKTSVHEALDKAAAQVTRASRIVGGLSHFIAHGEPEKTICCLHDVISDTCHSATADAENRGIKIRLCLQASDDKVLADQVQVQQVLTNLIRNATEAMAASPRRELTISTSSSDTEVRLDVADTGPGLCEKVKESLFEPFTTTKAEGMGVGLAISRAIVEAHDGRIWAAANPDGGATFSCTLPLIASLFCTLADSSLRPDPAATSPQICPMPQDDQAKGF